jgi:hypothetical protein
MKPSCYRAHHISYPKNEVIALSLRAPVPLMRRLRTREGLNTSTRRAEIRTLVRPGLFPILWRLLHNKGAKDDNFTVSSLRNSR